MQCLLGIEAAPDSAKASDLRFVPNPNGNKDQSGILHQDPKGTIKISKKQRYLKSNSRKTYFDTFLKLSDLITLMKKCYKFEIDTNEICGANISDNTNDNAEYVKVN